MENNNDKKLYTLLVYSENIAGILNQITAVFTRRQVNIESLNVSASSIKNIHKYTITVWSDAEQIEKINSTVLLAGLTEDIADLFHQLNSFDCLLQYSRSGRIAVTRSFDEPISDYLKKNSEE